MAYTPEETRRRLLEAAVDEFSAHGLAGARVDRIARAAGVNKERIYAHFGDKEALFGAALESELLAVIHAVPIEGEGAEAVLRYVEAVFDYHAAHPQLSRLLAWEGLERETPVAFEARSEAHRRKVSQLRRTLPALDDAAAAELLLTIVTLADGWQVFRSVDRLYVGDAADRPERVAARRAFVVRTVRALLESLVGS
ncbi:TetR family transcriptional regulator [Microbacterium barkeri]|uniref:TetR/AcrR family transcriptional regulator n=1 Tax=Microbacterium barkeri TaxID=33917 RepID=UPI0024AEEA06|nr:TetR family transcriptional regulator [Microbacterium barkeri]MDI6943312.1 TetR family transcriptional regulator [Microbacterium barkeri]